MQFFKFKDLAKSWSFQLASLVTVVPVINEASPLFSFIPDQYKPWAITILGAAVMLARAVKQTKTTFSNS